MIYLLIFVSCFFVFLSVRVFMVYLNRNVFKQGFFGDSSVHWTLVKAIKSDPNFKCIPQYLIGNEPASYPRAFHRYAALFPLEWVKRSPWVPNLILFSLFGGFSGIYVYHYFSIIGLPPLQGVAWFCVLFLFSVSNMTFDGPAIAYLKLSERLFGRIFTASYFLSMVIYVSYDDAVSLAIACISGALAISGAKFARQAILFITPMVAVGASSILPIAVLMLAVMVSLVLFRDHVINSILFQVQHLAVYVKRIRKSNVPKQAMTTFLDGKLVIAKSESIRRKVSHLLSREPTRALSRYPELGLLGTFVWATSLPDTHVFHSLILGAVVIYLLTTTSYLNFLGESYRYIEYSLSFILPLVLAEALVTNRDLIVIVPWYFMLVSVIVSGLYYISSRKNYLDKDELKLFLDKIKLSENDVVFPVSMRLAADICARVSCKSFWWQPGNITSEIFEKYVEEYPFLKKDWRALAELHNVTHVVCDKSALSVIDWKYDFSGLDVVHETDRYVAYKV